MERLLQAVQELSPARSLADIQRIVHTSARELTGCDGATFVLREEDEMLLRRGGRDRPAVEGQPLIEECISGWVMLNREPAVSLGPSSQRRTRA